MSSTSAPGARIGASDRPSSADLLRFLPLLAGAASLVLALATIGARPLWLDEAFTIGATNQLAESFWQRSGSMFLYYVLIAPFADVSVDPTWLRLPSAVFAAGSVAITVHVAARYFSRRVACWTATVMVPMWAVTRYAQEVRSYSLVMLLAALGWWLLFRLADHERRQEWLILGAVWVALVHCHPMAGLIVVAQLASLRMSPNSADGTSRSLLRRSAPAWILAGVLMVPMLASLASQDDGVAPDWVPPLGRWTVSNVLEMLAGPWGVGQILALIALVVASLVVALTGGDTEASWRRYSLLLWLWVPVATLVLVSIREPMLAGRFVIGSIPAAALVLAHGIDVLGRRRSLLAGGAVALALVPGHVMLQIDEGHPWDQAVEVIASDPTLASARHGVIFLDDSSRNGFEVNAAGSRALEATVPVAPTEPWGTYLRYYDEVELSSIEARLEQLDVLWLVEQFQAGVTEPPWHWGVDEPFERLGFCRDSTATFDYSIEVVRFVVCGS